MEVPQWFQTKRKLVYTNSASMINESQTGRWEACAARHSVRDEKTIKDYQGGKKKRSGIAHLFRLGL